MDSTSLFRGRQLYSRRYHDEFSAGTLPFSRWPGFVVSRTVGLAQPYACPSRICKSAEDRGFLCLCITGSISLIGNAAKRNACATGFSRLNRPHDLDKQHSPLLRSEERRVGKEC